MEKIREFIIKLFKIKTYENEYKKLNSEYNEIKNDYVLTLNVVDNYKKDLEKANLEIERLNQVCEEPLALINKEVSAIVEQYERCVEDFRELAKKHERMQHKAFADGRSSAYSELGIWNIEAHERGNQLIRLSDGSVVELITEDVNLGDDDIIIERYERCDL